MFIQPIGGLSVQNKNYKSNASFGVNSNSIKNVAKDAVEKAAEKVAKNASEEVSSHVPQKSFWDKLSDFFGGDGDDAFAPGGPFDSGSINYP